MAYIGKIPTAAPLTSSDVADGIITNAKLAQDIMSAETALAAIPDTTDEFLISNAGVLNRIDAQFFQNTPSFHAHLSGSHQAVVTATETVIAFNSETYDTGGCFNNTSGSVTLNGLTAPAYSFTPNVAGKYLIIFKMSNLTGAGNLDISYIYKNTTSQGEYTYNANIGNSTSHSIAWIVDFNGTGDYVTARRYHNAGSDKSTYANAGSTFFQGFKLIGI